VEETSRKLLFSAHDAPAKMEVVEVLRQTQLKRILLVGHSFGTLVAVELLKVLDEKIEAVIFLSPAYDIANAKSKRFMPLLNLAVSCFRVLPYSSFVRGRTDYTRYKDTGDWNLRRMFADIRNTTLRVHAFFLQQIYRYDQRDKWDNLIPTMVIHGTRDTLIPVDQALRLTAARPSIKLVLLENADHILILNNVVEVSRAIREFIGESLSVENVPSERA
jgi:pimeloyl-ACP methyl ester carboxylesterase